MEPTIHSGSYFIANRLVYKFSDPKRGDIAVFWHGESHENYVKRVIGVPGDEVIIRDGKVYVNGNLVCDDCAWGHTYVGGSSNEVEYRVPSGKYFLLGDNRQDSSDSRAWAIHYIDRKDFIAKYWFSLF